MSEKNKILQKNVSRTNKEHYSNIKMKKLKIYVVVIILGIIATIISLPLSYSDGRPIDGPLTMGFPFNVYSVPSEFGCASLSCLQPKIFYIGAIFNIIFFTLIIIFIHWIYGKIGEK